MSKVEYSPLALEDLKSINHYITDNWGEGVANRILKKIISDIRRLEQYPLSGVKNRIPLFVIREELCFLSYRI